MDQLTTDQLSLKVGQKVTYKPFSGGWEKGVIKSFSDNGNPFVVYHCNDDWKNYTDYTGAQTPLEDVYPGWEDEEMVTRDERGTATELSKRIQAYIDTLDKPKLRTGEENLFNLIPEPPYNVMIYSAVSSPGLFHCRLDNHRCLEFYLQKAITKINISIHLSHSQYTSHTDPLTDTTFRKAFIILSDEEIKTIFTMMMPEKQSVIETLLLNQKD